MNEAKVQEIMQLVQLYGAEMAAYTTQRSNVKLTTEDLEPARQRALALRTAVETSVREALIQM